ncbi:MAG: hypothetical protein HYT71_03065 [Candidatus Aenigmarchaeota archaeon]|nr:hypothetical protein [Candidatus Aenigmarchaeota archaeon]
MVGDNKLTYADTGVDRDLRAASKTGLADLKTTYKLSSHGQPIKLPYGMITPVGNGRYNDTVIEGIGTKVLVAQLAGRYDTIGVDAIAMAANDVIRSGARPIVLVDNIDLQKSEPQFVNELMKGLIKGAEESEAPLVGGEVADVPTLIKGIRENRGFHIVVSAVGEVYENGIIRGDGIVPGDIIVGLKAPNQHSNGVSLVRRTLFKEWGGVYEPTDVPDGLSRSVVDEVLEPTRIYVKQMRRALLGHDVKAAVHVTGDAYLKFDKLQEVNPGIGFVFDNFNPPPIYGVMQDAARKMGKEIDDEEMLKTFNMGWGFALVAAPQSVHTLIDSMGEGEPIGRVTNSGDITIKYKGKTIDLKR